MGTRIDLTGVRFGKLTALEYLKSKHKSYWKCVCDCGNYSIVFIGHLRNGHTKTCRKCNFYYKTQNGYIQCETPNGMFMFDEEDIEVVKRYTWYIHKNYVLTNSFINAKHETLLLHRVLMNAKSSQLIDHINMNPRDNRKLNLRYCTHSQNSMNRDKPINNTSGFKGVSWDKKRNKWCVYITCESKRTYLGRYETKIEAAKAYNEAAIKYFGEFAKLNVFERG